ncbi:hypothetical protein Tco_0922842 [Tanacetum coccineum]|uniref:Uncharacterized protein n=1 Tax=Tanacetum coccineum TaxID=301880 RepID=A0ABQ5D0A0_9ASTR
MANVIPPDYVNDVPVVEPNQLNVVPVIPKPVLLDEDEDTKEKEFEEEEEPQEEEDDKEVDIKEDKNEPKLTYPYEEVDPLNPPPPASDSEPKDVIVDRGHDWARDAVVPVRTLTLFFWFGLLLFQDDCVWCREDSAMIGRKKGKAKDEYYGKLILDLGNEVRSSVEGGAAAMENLVRKLGNPEEKAECKKLKKELEEARGFVFEERPNEAIDVPVEDEKSPSSESRGSFRDLGLLPCTPCNPTTNPSLSQSIPTSHGLNATLAIPYHTIGQDFEDQMKGCDDTTWKTLKMNGFDKFLTTLTQETHPGVYLT